MSMYMYIDIYSGMTHTLFRSDLQVCNFLVGACISYTACDTPLLASAVCKQPQSDVMRFRVNTITMLKYLSEYIW